MRPITTPKAPKSLVRTESRMMLMASARSVHKFTKKASILMKRRWLYVQDRL